MLVVLPKGAGGAGEENVCCCCSPCCRWSGRERKREKESVRQPSVSRLPWLVRMGKGMGPLLKFSHSKLPIQNTDGPLTVWVRHGEADNNKASPLYPGFNSSLTHACLNRDSQANPVRELCPVATSWSSRFAHILVLHFYVYFQLYLSLLLKSLCLSPSNQLLSSSSGKGEREFTSQQTTVREKYLRSSNSRTVHCNRLDLSMAWRPILYTGTGWQMCPCWHIRVPYSQLNPCTPWA